MMSSLGYKRNAKLNKTNVIGDGFPLTNFCRERWCQQINVPGIFFSFRCIFIGQCTLKLIIMSSKMMISQRVRHLIQFLGGCYVKGGFLVPVLGLDLITLRR